jgi:DNA-binding beta-propeller fold protein YncE
VFHHEVQSASLDRRCRAVGGLLLLALLCSPLASAANSAPLTLESKIPLGEVSGRIDHLAVDLKRQRIFVAELGNDTVGVVDLKERKTIQTLSGFKEPQGIGYVPSADTVYVANGGNGVVRIFQGAELTAAGQIDLGDDADNVRVDEAAHQVLVGYGGGAIAVIDSTNQAKLADIALKAHPESFRLDTGGKWIYVNVPHAHQIAVIDRVARKQTAGWSTGTLLANYPLILDEPHQRILSVFRFPARVGVFAEDGKLVTRVETCGDSDDAFIDGKRNLVYVICGAGYVDVLKPNGDTYASLGRIETNSGARTGLFVPELDRLVVAVRARGSEPAAVWVYRPLP